MPSVTPRRVTIADPTGTRREVSPYINVTGSAWVGVQRVWVWDPNAGASGSWQVAWANGATANPTSVTIAYATGPTRVTVSWTLPSPRTADSYNVYRPDGSFVGTAGATATSLVDQDPRPLNGAYTVKAVLGGGEVAVGANSNTLNLNLAPATFTGTWDAVNQRVNFGGTANALGAPDSWNFYRATPDGSFVGSAPPAPGPQGYDPLPGGIHRGYQIQYLCRAVLSGIEAAAGTTVTVNVPPLPSQPQTLGTINNSGGVRFTYWGPPAGTATDYRIQTWQNGVWTDRGYSPTTNGQTAGLFDWTANNTGSPAVYARVATRSPGGESDWAQIGYINAVFDTTAPGDVVWHSFVPEASYGRMVMRAACPADSDLAYAQIERYTPGVDGGWTVLWASAVSPGQELALDVGTFAPGQTINCRVYLRDSAGNARYSSERAYTLTASPFTVVANDTDYWVGGSYNPAGDARPRQGPGVVGLWYYGNTIPTVLAAYSVYRVECVMVQRTGNAGELHLCVHNDNRVTRPPNGAGGLPSLAGDFVFANMAAGQSVTADLPQDFILNWAFNGYKGLGCFWNYAGATTKVMANVADNSFTGLMQFHHLG